MLKVKVKVPLYTPYDIKGGVELHLHSSLTPTLEVGEWLASRSSCFTPKEPPRVLVDWEVGSASDLGWLLPVRGFEPRTVQPVPQ